CTGPVTFPEFRSSGRVHRCSALVPEEKTNCLSVPRTPLRLAVPVASLRKFPGFNEPTGKSTPQTVGPALKRTDCPRQSLFWNEKIGILFWVRNDAISAFCDLPPATGASQSSRDPRSPTPACPVMRRPFPSGDQTGDRA